MTLAECCAVLSKALIEHSDSISLSLESALTPLNDLCQAYVFQNYVQNAKENKTILVFLLENDHHAEHSIENCTNDIRLFLKSVEQNIELNSHIMFTDKQKVSLASTFSLGTAKRLITDLAFKNEFKWQSLKENLIACVDPFPVSLTTAIAKLLAIKREPGENLQSLYLRCVDMKDLLLNSFGKSDANVDLIIGDHFSLCVSETFNRRLKDDEKSNFSNLLKLALVFCYDEGIVLPNSSERTTITTCLTDSPHQNPSNVSECNLSDDNSHTVPSIMQSSGSHSHSIHNVDGSGSPRLIQSPESRSRTSANLKAKLQRKQGRRCYKCGIYNQHIARFCPKLEVGNRMSPLLNPNKYRQENLLYPFVKWDSPLTMARCM